MGAEAMPLEGERQRAVLAALWPPAPARSSGTGVRSGGTVYAVLDPSRDRAILSLLRDSRMPMRCLFRGALHPELEAVAPHLATLSPDSPLLSAWLGEGWGRRWGIFLRSRSGFEALYRHLRHFLQVQDPEGRTLYFRYYDPRVLGLYLPTCNAAERAVLFREVEAFAVEVPEHASLRWFQQGPERLEVSELPPPQGP